MNLDARTERTLLRVGVLLAAILICTGIVILFPNLDPRYLEAVYGLGITAALGLDQWIKNSGPDAPPTVEAVTEALRTALNNPVVSVIPPKERVPRPPMVREHL